MVESADSTAVFDRHGLRKAGFWRSIAVSRDRAESTSADDLSGSLAQLGGVYAQFARFLCWRAELVGARHIAALRAADIALPAPSRADASAVIQAELPLHAESLTSNLDPDCLWNLPHRVGWRTRYNGLPVVLQFAKPAVTEAGFTDFENKIQEIQRTDVARISSPHVIAEFRQWLRDGEALEREKKFLEVIHRSSAETLIRYPALIPELCTEKVLCWPFIEGQPARQLIESGSGETATLIAVAIFEQLFTLGIVDSDIDIDAFVVQPDGTLTLRRLNRIASVPPVNINPGMKYIAAVLAGDSTVTVQTLFPLAAGHSSATLEASLLNALSAVEPELKVKLRYPRSAAAFESNWRALSRLHPVIPAWLNGLHRNLIAVGYWNAEAITHGSSVADALEDAQWPVLRRVLTSQASQLLNSAALTEWTAGAGLLLFGSLREVNRLAEEIRENSLTIGVETTAAPPPAKEANHGLTTRVGLAFLLIVFIACLHWGSTATGSFAVLLQVTAVVSVFALFWNVSRIR